MVLNQTSLRALKRSPDNKRHKMPDLKNFTMFALLSKPSSIQLEQLSLRPYLRSFVKIRQRHKPVSGDQAFLLNRIKL